MLTHLIDYMRWFNGEAEAEWVMAQAAGRGKLADAHPSPDYIAGFIQFANGVRGIVECGAGAPDVPGGRLLVAQVPHRRAGHGRLRRSAHRRRLARRDQAGRVQSGEGCMNYDLDMPPYIQQMADWLDDDTQGPSLQLRERLQGLRDHDGALPLGGAGRPGGAAAHGGRRTRSSCSRPPLPTGG